MMHFPPVSDFPLFSKNFRALTKICKILPFLEKFLDFHPPKFLMTFFLSHPPYFRCFSTFPLCFAKIIISPPPFTNFPPCFTQIHLLLHTLRVFRFPPTFTMMHLCITQCTYWTPLTAKLNC